MALILTRAVLSVALKRNQGLTEGKGTPEKVHLTPIQLLRTLAAQGNQGNTGKPPLDQPQLLRGLARIGRLECAKGSVRGFPVFPQEPVGVGPDFFRGSQGKSRARSSRAAPSPRCATAATSWGIAGRDRPLKIRQRAPAHDHHTPRRHLHQHHGPWRAAGAAGSWPGVPACQPP